jgi:carotenoid cleavage dioxygenase
MFLAAEGIKGEQLTLTFDFHHHFIHESTTPTIAKMTSSPGISAIPPEAKARVKERTKGHDHPYLSGNFYPVFEETVGDDGIECQIIGTIPESLRGSQYVRTGPNSLNVPDDDGPHHFFEGEGMAESLL